MIKLKIIKFVTLVTIISGSFIYIITASEKEESKAISEANDQLINAVRRGTSAQIKESIKNGADINTESIFGTPLQLAAAERDPSIIQLLLDTGANVNQKCNDNVTPLHFAGMYNKLKTIKLLISSGADVNAQHAINNFTPLLTYLYYMVEFYSSIIIDLDIIQLFLNNGTDLTSKSTANEGPLEFAIKFKNIENMQEVLKLLKNWQEKQKQTICKEVGEYLIPDIVAIAGEYVVGPIKIKEQETL